MIHLTREVHLLCQMDGRTNRTNEFYKYTILEFICRVRLGFFTLLLTLFLCLTVYVNVRNYMYVCVSFFSWAHFFFIYVHIYLFISTPEPTSTYKLRHITMFIVSQSAETSFPLFSSILFAPLDLLSECVFQFRNVNGQCKWKNLTLQIKWP